ELVRDFGEPADAARLIRRAKKRCRPAAWRAAVRTLQAALLLLALAAAVYSFAAARAFMSHPTIARNYLDELNAPIEALPDSDRAWPLYREAYLALPTLPKDLAKDFPDIEPSDTRWPLALDYLAACAKPLDLVRRASSKPTLGRPLTTVTDIELEIHTQVRAGINPGEARKSAEQAAHAAASDPNPPLIGILLPHLGHGRHFARILSLDARAAAHAGDAARVVNDLEAMFRLSAHMSDNAFLIGGLVELAIHAQAQQTLAQVLNESPSLFSDEQLAALAHLVARSPSPISFQGELLGFDDSLQRIYSDDANGDGHLTADGARLLRSYMGNLYIGDRVDPWRDVPDKVRHAIEVPALSLAGASRKENRDLFAGMVARTAAYAALNPWDRPNLSPDEEVREFLPTHGAWRYPLVAILMPALSRAVWSYDRTFQTRDALLVAIACELYKRRFGEYPPSLDALPSSLLAHTPLDVFDGKPLRYTLRDANPLIYSLGPDRKDDHARPFAKPNPGGPRWMTAQQAKEALTGPTAAEIDGDWVLWPPEPRKPKPADPQ
ncbi:MAG: hypothetical protein JNL50_09045, partial [Phycisphaerae bacterium]|nr:hypothetical protein [Phycisphaerae bacterium]